MEKEIRMMELRIFKVVTVEARLVRKYYVSVGFSPLVIALLARRFVGSAGRPISPVPSRLFVDGLNDPHNPASVLRSKRVKDMFRCRSSAVSILSSPILSVPCALLIECSHLPSTSLTGTQIMLLVLKVPES